MNHFIARWLGRLAVESTNLFVDRVVMVWRATKIYPFDPYHCVSESLTTLSRGEVE